jgi:hypothetical protein
MGTTHRFACTFRGRDDVVRNLFAEVGAVLASGRMVPVNALAEGDQVVVEFDPVWIYAPLEQVEDTSNTVLSPAESDHESVVRSEVRFDRLRQRRDDFGDWPKAHL